MSAPAALAAAKIAFPSTDDEEVPIPTESEKNSGGHPIFRYVTCQRFVYFCWANSDTSISFRSHVWTAESFVVKKFPTERDSSNACTR